MRKITTKERYELSTDVQNLLKKQILEARPTRGALVKANRSIETDSYSEQTGNARSNSNAPNEIASLAGIAPPDAPSERSYLFRRIPQSSQMRVIVRSTMQEPNIDPQELSELAQTKMPFGKYQGRFLVDLPEPYLVWFRKQGFPKGKLGRQLEAMYEIKLNGLESLVRPLVQR